MKEMLKQIIENMQAEIDRDAKYRAESSVSSDNDEYFAGYAAACGDYLQDLLELYDAL